MTRRKSCRTHATRQQKQRRKKGILTKGSVRCAIKRYAMHRNRFNEIRRMKSGYLAMGAINRALANEAAYADEQQLFAYEQFLSESES